MKKYLAFALTLPLVLAACGSNGTPMVYNPSNSNTGKTTKPIKPITTTPTTPSTPTNSDALPDVARTQPTSAPNCQGASAPLSSILMSPGMLDRGNKVHLFTTQATQFDNTIYGLLAATKTYLNKYYFGYSTVDLNTLHNENYNNFHTIFPNNFRTYNLNLLSKTQTDQVDTLMANYVHKIQDGHTFYLNAAQTKEMHTGGSDYPDFGASYVLVPDGDGLLVTDVQLGTPAQQAGLKRGDVITSINGTALTRGSLNDNDAAKQFYTLLYTAADTQKPVAMEVRFAGQPRTISIEGKVLRGTAMPWGEVRTDNKGTKHYYLRIPTFYSVAPQQTDDNPWPIAKRVHELLAEAKTAGTQDVVIDLRNDGGGYLMEFVGAVGPFAPSIAGETTRAIDGTSATYSYESGSVMYQESCKAKQKAATFDNTTWTGKATVLVDVGSASASEMFSSNMQAAGYKVVGVPTYGIGGTATDHFDLPGSRSISITDTRAYIGDKPIPEHITPDIVSADDFKQLAAKGVDNTLQVAYDSMK